LPSILRRTALLLTAAVLVGCGGRSAAVPVTVPNAPAANDCAKLAAALPHTLDGRARRATRPASELVAAWGSPAIVLRCGVPAARTSAGDHIDADGVSWLTPGAVKGMVVWTTTGRTTSIELSVPESVNDQENLLGDLAPAVSGSLSRAPAPASATATPGSATPSG
jgi:hypothetical protein